MISGVVKATVQAEVRKARQYGESYGWEFSEPDFEKQLFTVLLTSPLDGELYLIEFTFDDYPKKPYLIEFLHPKTKERGQRKCFPKGHDSFFNQSALVICHPCNRKAYKGYSGIHPDWDMAGWRLIAAGMIELWSILDGMYGRISNKEFYDGRLQ